MIKLTNFQKRILKQNLAEIAAKNTEAYFGDLVFAFEWIDNHEKFNEDTRELTIYEDSRVLATISDVEEEQTDEMFKEVVFELREIKL